MARKTFTLLFFIKRTKELSNGEVPVYLRITIDGKRAEFGLNRSIKASNWDAKRSRAKGKGKEAVELNSYMDSIRMQLYRLQKELEEDGKEVTAASLKNAYQGTPNEFSGLLDLFADHNKKMCESAEAGETAKGTYDRYRHSIGILREYAEKILHKKEISFGDLNYRFLVEYEHYLKSKRRCQHNSAMKRMRELRKVVLIARKYGLIKQDPFDDYTISTQKVERVILSQEELDQIRSAELASRRLEDVRLLFLFQCYTGISYVDMLNLTEKNISTDAAGNRWLTFKRGKTSTLCKLPLLRQAIAVMEKLRKGRTKSGKLLPVISNQKYNVYLKEVAAACGVDKALTSHMARHTFATIVTLSNGVGIETVGKMLGHRKLSTTQIYAQVLDGKILSEMSNLDDQLKV